MRKSSKNEEIVPKSIVLQKKFWYVNAGLLSGTNFDRAVILIATTKLPLYELQFVIFLGVKYLIHYIELYIFDPTCLLVDCTTKQLKYLQALLGKQRKAKNILSYHYIVEFQRIFEKLYSLENDNHICRQMYIDYIEKLSLLLVSRIQLWQRNPHLQAYLFRYNFDPFRSAVIYNIFLIPNQEKYINPLLNMDQKIIEKIESRCHCKILLTMENDECVFSPEFVRLEIIFDLYKGNYLGFLDMLKYILKILNSTRYVAKSLRTVLIEGSLLYNILTNVPVNKLKYLEKNVVAGLPVASFLDASSTSKQLYSILATIKQHDPNRDVNMKSKLVKEFELDSCSLNYYENHEDANVISHLKDCIGDVIHSQAILNYFQFKYDGKLKGINKGFSVERRSTINKEMDSPDDITNVNKSLETIIKDSPNSDKNLFVKNLSSLILNKDNNNKNNISDNLPRTKHFDDMKPEEQFDLIIGHSLQEYGSKFSWINHKLRLMMRCNTKETLDDINHPYIFEKISLKDRMKRKSRCQNKFTYVPSHKASFKCAFNVVPPSNQQSLPRQSWLSEDANKILTHGLGSQNKSSDDQTNGSSLITLEEDRKDDLSPSIVEYLKSYDDIVQHFILTHILYSRPDWNSFLEMKIQFPKPNLNDAKSACNALDIFKGANYDNTKDVIKFDSLWTQKIYTLLYFLNSAKLSEQAFRSLNDGVGLNLTILSKIVKHPSTVPIQIGKPYKLEDGDVKVNLSNCMSRLVYDLHLLAQHDAQELVNVFSFHISLLRKCLMTSVGSIRIAFEKLNIVARLKSIKVVKMSFLRDNKLYQAETHITKELKILHEMIFRIPCCSYQMKKNAGISILYHSMYIDNQLNVVEPFLRLPEDERLQKIEKESECCIVLRIQKSSIIHADECVIDIYYDFENDNHFHALDMLKGMMRFQHKLFTTQKHRSLVLFPTGELWVFREFEWIKKFLTV